MTCRCTSHQMHADRAMEHERASRDAERKSYEEKLARAWPHPTPKPIKW